MKVDDPGRTSRLQIDKVEIGQHLLVRTGVVEGAVEAEGVAEVVEA